MTTSNKSSPKRTVILLTLMVALSAFLLISFNNFVEARKPKVEGQINTILEQVVPGATEFKPVTDGEEEIIYYEAYDEEGKQRGYGFIFTGQGMWGEIRYAAGIDQEYKMTGMTVLDQSETPGLGARIEEPWFQEQFQGLKAEEMELEKFGGKIDTITGATTTTKAVADAMKNEITKIESIIEG